MNYAYEFNDIKYKHETGFAMSLDEFFIEQESLIRWKMKE